MTTTSGIAAASRRRSPAALAALTVLILATIAGLAALGTWQLQRRVWKLDLIARVQQRVHAVPLPAPGPSAWPQISADHDAYRRVRVGGVLLNDKETLVQAVTEQGPGFWVLTPLRTPQGFLVLVNRGFVPPERRDPATRLAGEIAGETTVVGLLRMSEPKGGFLRANALAEDRWYSRDVSAIAATHGLPNVAPYFIDADAHPNPGGWPLGGLTVIAFPNSHLVYAITWYGLALMLAGASAYLAWKARRERRTSESPP